MSHEDHRQALLAIIEFLHRNKHVRALLDIHAVVHRFPDGGGIYPRAAVIVHDDVQRLHAIASSSGAAPAMHAAVASLDAALRLLPSASHIAVFDDNVVGDAVSTTGAIAMAPNAALLARGVSAERAGLIHDAALRSAKERLFYDARGPAASRTKQFRPSSSKRSPSHQQSTSHSLSTSQSPSTSSVYLRAISIHIGEHTSVAGMMGDVIISTSDDVFGGLPGLHAAGALPPGVPLAFVERLHSDPRVIARYLELRSGIGAMAGGKSSYREITDGALAHDRSCLRALSFLSRRVAAAAAGIIPDLGGVDLIVFSGDGSSWMVREDVCRRLAHLGVVLDEDGLRRTDGVHSARGSRVQAMTIVVDDWSAMHDAALRAGNKA